MLCPQSKGPSLPYSACPVKMGMLPLSREKSRNCIEGEQKEDKYIYKKKMTRK